MQHPMLVKMKNKIHLPSIEAESTATIVWDYLCKKEIISLFWNSFPFHSHENGNVKGNRAPNDVEVKFGATILSEIFNLYKPEFVAGIGHKGVAALEQIFPEQKIRYIRHPSNGGKSQFIEGMNSVI